MPFAGDLGIGSLRRFLTPCPPGVSLHEGLFEWVGGQHRVSIFRHQNLLLQLDAGFLLCPHAAVDVQDHPGLDHAVMGGAGEARVNVRGTRISFAATAKPCLARTRAVGGEPVCFEAQRFHSAGVAELLVLQPS